MDSPTGVLLVLSVGVFIVVAGILLLRLHAFLALVLAALAVALLTPASSLERYYIEEVSQAVRVSSDSPDIVLIKGDSRPRATLVLLKQNATTRRYEEVGTLQVLPKDDSTPPNFISAKVQLAGAGEGQASGEYRAIDPLQWKSALKKSRATIGERVAAGFGSTCASIGILVAMASIIGNCMLHSGAADRIVRTMLGWFGEQGAPAAFMLSGFLLGIPVFFDTVFYLLIPLGKAMYVRTGKNYLFYVLTIICGGTMTHSLVPPTPGPLIAAQQLNVSLATMILGGLIVGFCASCAGYLYAAILNRRCTLPLRDSSELSVEQLTATLNRNETDLPPFGVSLWPILLPVVLITLDASQEFMKLGPAATYAISLLGDKNIAITLGAAAGMAILVAYRRPSRSQIADSVQKELAGAGIIILITAGGGAFGGVIRETGVASMITALPDSSPIMLCTIAFVVTVAIRTAQGSATVAMVTAGGLFSGLAHAGTLGFHPVYLALSIGCGSKPFGWMADSGFWVMTRMSGMTETEGLKYITPMTAVMGLVGFLVTLVGVVLWPSF